MIRLSVVVEGKTELEFVKRCLATHLVRHEVCAMPTIVTTKTGPKPSKGGGHWTHWHKHIRNVLASHDRVTTLFDLYGLPKDFPGLAACSTERDTVKRITTLEAAMAAKIDDRRFIPYLQRHEFEALVLAGLDHLEGLLVDADARAGLDALRTELINTEPEDVNDGPETAPSKRLLARIPGYQKATHGPLVAEAVGIEALKQRCPRFGAWVRSLEALGDGSTDETARPRPIVDAQPEDPARG